MLYYSQNQLKLTEIVTEYIQKTYTNKSNNNPRFKVCNGQTYISFKKINKIICNKVEIITRDINKISKECIEYNAKAATNSTLSSQ